jgi:hypothetical protein
MYLIRNFKIHKLSILLVLVVILLSTCSSTNAQQVQKSTASAPQEPSILSSPDVTTAYEPTNTFEDTPTITPTAYLPIVTRPEEKFIGIYLNEYWTTYAVTSTLEVIDQQIEKKHTSVGWFIDLQNIAFTDRQPDNSKNNFYRQLEALWSKGYISFVNLGSALEASEYAVGDNCPIAFSADQVTNGACDVAIQKIADLYLQWVSQGQGRRAMIAPLQEMNGVWTSYGRDPNTAQQVIAAYRHIIDIFNQKGVSHQQVWWVFAPNGYSDPGNDARKFENYYPGDDVVDLVSFSSYNYGFCPSIQSEYRRWESYSEIFEPYIARMQTMAPTKPVIIAETATVPWYGQDGEGNPKKDIGYMNQWLVENYDYFAKRSGVIGVFYFNFPKFDGYECDFVINPNDKVLTGYKDATANPVYVYFNPKALDELIHQYK